MIMNLQKRVFDLRVSENELFGRISCTSVIGCLSSRFLNFVCTYMVRLHWGNPFENKN